MGNTKKKIIRIEFELDDNSLVAIFVAAIVGFFTLALILAVGVTSFF